MEILTLDQSEVVKNPDFWPSHLTSSFRGRIAEPGIQSRAFTILDSGFALHALRNDGREFENEVSIFAKQQLPREEPIW